VTQRGALATTNCGGGRPRGSVSVPGASGCARRALPDLFLFALPVLTMARKLLIALAAALAASSQDELAALESDEICHAGSDCTLSALQLKGEKSSSEEKEMALEEAQEDHETDETDEAEDSSEQAAEVAAEDAAEEAAEAADEAEDRAAATEDSALELKDLHTARAHDSDEEELFPGAYALYSTERCRRTIPHSSCMVFGCKRSRGPVDCGISTGYYCRCGPGYCSDGHGCYPAMGYGMHY